MSSIKKETYNTTRVVKLDVKTQEVSNDYIPLPHPNMERAHTHNKLRTHAFLN